MHSRALLTLPFYVFFPSPLGEQKRFGVGLVRERDREQTAAAPARGAASAAAPARRRGHPSIRHANISQVTV